MAEVSIGAILLVVSSDIRLPEGIMLEESVDIVDDESEVVVESVVELSLHAVKQQASAAIAKIFFILTSF